MAINYSSLPFRVSGYVLKAKSTVCICELARALKITFTQPFSHG